MQKGMTSIGKMVMQAALATVLIVTGLLVFAGGRGNEVSQAINQLLGKSTGLKEIVLYILAVVDIAAGVLLILDFFHIDALDKIDDLALLVVMIAWCLFILIVDVFPLFQGRFHFLPWLGQLAQHVLVLSTMIVVKAKI